MGEINWVTVVGSSAVIAALISGALNIGFNVWAKRGDRRREDAKEAKKAGHVYLGVALSLEAFAKQCSDYVYDIESAFDRKRSHNMDDAWSGLKSAEMIFEPDLNWLELPILSTAI